jgi:hypothetical protein
MYRMYQGSDQAEPAAYQTAHLRQSFRRDKAHTERPRVPVAGDCEWNRPAADSGDLIVAYERSRGDVGDGVNGSIWQGERQP